MRNLFLSLLFCICILYSCSDGDILDVEFDFDNTFLACEQSDLLFYKTKEDPSETVSVQISGISLNDIITGDEDVREDIPVTFNYRSYNRVDLPNDLFCNIVPPANLNIAIDQSDDCLATIRRTLVEDDNDGVPSAQESENGIDPLGDDDGDGVANYLDDAPNDDTTGDVNGLIEAGFDTDGDGLPNFIDADDDGDNVLTTNERPDDDGDGDLSDAQDTDADGTPDYLDADDDNDGVLTRDEENVTPDQNPIDDVTNPDIGADYLNPNVSNTVPATAYRSHAISQTYNVSLVVTEINIDFLLQQELDFGFLDNSILDDSRTVTPSFP